MRRKGFTSLIAREFLGKADFKEGFIFVLQVLHTRERFEIEWVGWHDCVRLGHGASSRAFSYAIWTVIKPIGLQAGANVLSLR